MLLKEIIAKVPEMAQRQDSVTEQMRDLLAVATRLGMYDACDWIRNAFFAVIDPPKLRLGFTGTQLGMTKPQLDALHSFMAKNPFTEFRHGDCIGADKQAHNLVMSSFQKANVIIHPPINPAKRARCAGDWTVVDPRIRVLAPKSYLDRNVDIVDCTDMLVAAPSTSSEELRSGTWATVRYARKRGRKVTIICPDGSIIS